MISVIVPVFRNEPTLAELHRRIARELERVALPYEILFVDDASDDRSVDEIKTVMSRAPAVRLLSLPRNAGQQTAVLRGMREAKGDLVATLDADLQDPPEALGILISCIDDSTDAVFAGRRGEYESKGRLRVSRLFKGWMARLTKLPLDAGMYLVMKASVARAILDATPTPFYLPTAVMAVTSRVASVPVERERRPEGVSQYTAWSRARVGIGAAIGAVRWRLRKQLRSR